MIGIVLRFLAGNIPISGKENRLGLVIDWVAEEVDLADNDNSNISTPRHGDRRGGKEKVNHEIYIVHSTFGRAVGARDWLIGLMTLGPDVKTFRHNHHPDDCVDATPSRYECRRAECERPRSRNHVNVVC
ncbi:hypothetical protein THARTR1_08676 [Trichoderma harzianum]|uniref:Uncharacterized protein n=1 Tax=Trichoderma harzianum TaxID=5544 RepID=A0A2K0TYQ4_TRIHA|nr:hypothetical protein THARTR1_08676 [Trichoderma harzianum]